MEAVDAVTLGAKAGVSVVYLGKKAILPSEYLATLKKSVVSVLTISYILGTWGTRAYIPI